MMVNTLIDCDFLDELTHPQQHRFNGAVSFFLQYDCHEAVDAYLEQFQPRASDVSQALCNTILSINRAQQSVATQEQLTLIRRLMGLGADPTMTVPVLTNTMAMGTQDASGIILDHPCKWLHEHVDLLKSLLAHRGYHWGKPEGKTNLLAWIRKDGCMQFAASQIAPDILETMVFAKVFYLAATFDMTGVKSNVQRTARLLSNTEILPAMNTYDLQEIFLGAAIRSLRLLRDSSKIEDLAQIQAWWQQDPLLFRGLCAGYDKASFLEIWNGYKQIIIQTIETTAQALNSGGSEELITVAEQQVAAAFEGVLLQCDTMNADGQGRRARL